MPPLVGTRLPPSAKQIATAPTANPQVRKASGAYGPTHAARAPGTAKMPAPTIMLTMLAAKAQGPTARTNPISRWFSRTDRLPLRVDAIINYGLQSFRPPQLPDCTRARRIWRMGCDL